jgi:hypothetical protein
MKQFAGVRTSDSVHGVESEFEVGTRKKLTNEREIEARL